MPFGLVNAPATFERMMELVLRGLTWQKCLVYLDDILCFGRDFEDTLERLKLVLDHLDSAGLRMKASKCNLFQTKLPFLGHVVSEEGISTDPEKVRKIKEWPTPQDVHQLRSFAGLCSYYRRYIEGFAEIAHQLYRLTKKDTPFSWGEEQQVAYNSLKEALTTAPVLGFPISGAQWVIDTDASNYGIAGVLQQVQDGQEWVIAYMSRQRRSQASLAGGADRISGGG